MKNKCFFSIEGGWGGGKIWMENSITFNVFFYWNLPLVTVIFITLVWVLVIVIFCTNCRFLRDFSDSIGDCIFNIFYVTSNISDTDHLNMHSQISVKLRCLISTYWQFVIFFALVFDIFKLWVIIFCSIDLLLLFLYTLAVLLAVVDFSSSNCIGRFWWYLIIKAKTTTISYLQFGAIH